MPGGSETLDELVGRGVWEFLKPELRDAGEEWGPVLWRTEEPGNLGGNLLSKEHLSLEGPCLL